MAHRPDLRFVLLALLTASPWACKTDVFIPAEGPPPDGSGLDADGGPGQWPDGATNSPPGPVAIGLSPVEPRTGDDLLVAVEEEAIDPDGGPDPVTLHYRWFENGDETPHTASEIPAAITRRGDIWRVEVRAFDGLAEGPATEAEVIVINTPPTLESAAISPPSADVDTVLVCEAGARSDPDDDAISIAYAWVLDDVFVEGEETNALAPPLAGGGHYRCRATPFDGSEYGEHVWSSEVIVGATVVTDAMISIQPKSLDLGIVLPGEVSTASFEIHNIGEGDLDLLSAELTGELGFGLAMDLPVTVPSGTYVVAEASFSTDDPGLKKGNIAFETNAINPAAAQIPLLGVGAAPCLLVQPTSLPFGGAYVASHHEKELTLISCGILPVVVDSVVLLAPDGTPFQLDMSPGPGPLPWELAPGAKTLIKVRFEPNEPSDLNADGNPIDETATVSIQTTGVGPVFNIPVSGFASAQGCPAPVIDIAEGHFVSPETLLHLDASNSIAPSGSPSLYSWAVTVPPGAPDSPFDPDPSSAVVTYPADVLGTYTFALKVFDQVDGNLIEGCGTATWSVTVKDAIPLIVELFWDSPGDGNQDDTGPGMGVDLDLHMHDGLGDGVDYDGDGQPDSWFDVVHDVYWFDTSPDWGLPGAINDPILVIEDPDGKGPERIEYHDPVVGSSYTLGAHCWSAYDYGPSIATLRIYHFESLVTEVTDVVLGHGDLWEAGVLGWPKAELVPSIGADGGAKITAGYPNPFQ